MLNRKYNKRSEKNSNKDVDGNDSDSGANAANSSNSKQQQQQLQQQKPAASNSDNSKQLKKNLHVSTSLPGPLAGYKRKRTQAVQAGDDSEFYASTKIGKAHPEKIGSDLDEVDDVEEDEDEETADYDETTPQHNLADVTTISQQTTPVKQLPQQKQPPETTATPSTPPSVAMVNNAIQQAVPSPVVTSHQPRHARSSAKPTTTSRDVPLPAKTTTTTTANNNKCLSDSSGEEAAVDSPNTRRNNSNKSHSSTRPLSKVTSPARSSSKSSQEAEPLIKATIINETAAMPTSGVGGSTGNKRQQPQEKPKSNASSIRDINSVGKSDDVKDGTTTEATEEDEEEGGGFFDAVRGVFHGRFASMQKRGDIENVVVKFAGNLVSQIGLEKTKVEVPRQIVVEREQWDSKVDFLLSVVGFAVDLSAVWRFPAVCFSNGGGAFLLPYIIMILICGLPLMYMEFCLGQFQRNGCITIWKKICPMFKGLGFAICVITSIIAMYYNTIMAWSLYILLSSISPTLPWESCNNPWNSNDSCVTFEERTRLTRHVLEIIRNCTLSLNSSTTPSVPLHESSTAKQVANQNEPFLFLRTDLTQSVGGAGAGSGGVGQHPSSLGSGIGQHPSIDYNPSDAVTGFDRDAICNITAMSGTTKFVFQNQISSAEEYFYNGVLELNRSNGFSDLGAIKWQISLCLLSIFVIVYFALWKGVKSSGKAVWFTATFPYAVLLVLLFRVMTLPGSWTGVQYYITPNLDSLYQLKVWQEAAGQVLFQLGPGFGVLLALSSYNKFHNNCLTDAIITTAISSFTSIMAGFVVFGTLGYIAGMLDKSIDQLEAFGHGLTFVAYPEAISTLPGAPIWSVLFFAMLINLGLDTTFGGLESMITGLLDYLPVKLYRRREYFVMALIVYIYLGALPTCTYGGILLVQFYDSYGVEIPLLLIAFLECVGVCYVYGIPQFSKDIAMMHGHEPAAFWKFCWCFVSPFVVLFSFVAACFREKDTRYRNIEYPAWAGYLGWGLTFFSISCVPVYIIYLFISTPGSIKQRLVAMIGENAWILTVLREREERRRAAAAIIVDNSNAEYGANNNDQPPIAPPRYSLVPAVPAVAAVDDIEKPHPQTEQKIGNKKKKKAAAAAKDSSKKDEANSNNNDNTRPPTSSDQTQQRRQQPPSQTVDNKKLATIVDMHYDCDITPRSSPTAPSKAIV